MRPETFPGDLEDRITVLRGLSNADTFGCEPPSEALIQKGAKLARDLFEIDSRLGDCWLGPSWGPAPKEGQRADLSLDFVGPPGVGRVAGILIAEDCPKGFLVAVRAGSSPERLLFDLDSRAELQEAADLIKRVVWGV